MGGIGSHERPNEGETNVWLTPPTLLDKLPHFDLDPCASVDQPWATADKMLTIHDDGLTTPWGDAFVWCNPPYGYETQKWLKKMAEHNNGIALIFARTETKMFFNYVWPHASCLLFLKGRLKFHRPNGEIASMTAGGPSVLVGYGERAAESLEQVDIAGAYVDRRLIEINEVTNE